MSLAPTLVVTPAQAADAYARTASGGSAESTGFAPMLERALNDALNAGDAAETASRQAITGEGSMANVVTAIARAELVLQTATAVRDRVLQAYQDIMKMPI